MTKRYILIGAALAVITAGLFAVNSQVHAQSTFSNQDAGAVTIAKDVVHDGSYYATGQDVVIDGTINGDLYCASQTVRISGTVTGDVLCATQKITVDGVVKQDVRVAAQNVMVTGQVGGTLTALAQDVELAKGGVVAGDINGAAQTITIAGTVKRDVAVAAQKLSIAGLVEGSASVVTESLVLTSQPAIAGGLDYTSSQKQTFNSAAVTGPVSFHEAKDADAQKQDFEAVAAKVWLIVALMLVFTAIILAFIAPRTFERSYTIVRRRIGIVALTGIAVGFGLPVLAITLFITVLGVPLGMLAMVVLGMLYLLTFPFAAYYMGRALFGKVVSNILLLMLAGSVLLCLLLLVPVLNVIVTLGMFVMGIGGVVTTVLHGYQRPRYGITDIADDTSL